MKYAMWTYIRRIFFFCPSNESRLQTKHGWSSISAHPYQQIPRKSVSWKEFDTLQKNSCCWCTTVHRVTFLLLHSCLTQDDHISVAEETVWCQLFRYTRWQKLENILLGQEIDLWCFQTSHQSCTSVLFDSEVWESLFALSSPRMSSTAWSRLSDVMALPILCNQHGDFIGSLNNLLSLMTKCPTTIQLNLFQGMSLHFKECFGVVCKSLPCSSQVVFHTWKSQSIIVQSFITYHKLGDFCVTILGRHESKSNIFKIFPFLCTLKQTNLE